MISAAARVGLPDSLAFPSARAGRCRRSRPAAAGSARQGPFRFHLRMALAVLAFLCAAMTAEAALTLQSRSAGLELPTKEEGRTEFEVGDVDGDGELDLVSVGDHGSPLAASPWPQSAQAAPLPSPRAAPINRASIPLPQLWWIPHATSRKPSRSRSPSAQPP